MISQTNSMQNPNALSLITHQRIIKSPISLTDKQKQILKLLYKFRFITVHQLQTYFNHKDPHRIKEWLTDLKNKGCVAVINNPSDPTKPYIYCLATKAKYTLKDNEDVDGSFLGRLYKEKNLQENFRNHCLTLVDIYLYFVSQLEKDATLHFFTQQDLTGYDFFPEKLPDVYIVIVSKDGRDTYFLDLFDEYRKPAGVARFNVRKYITYCDEGSFQANTQNSPFPSLLFVVSDYRRQKHVFMYAKALLEKAFDDISLFLTTKDKIKISENKTNIWQQVE